MSPSPCPCLDGVARHGTNEPTRGCFSPNRQQLELVSSSPAPEEEARRSLEDALAGTDGQHQPLGMASLPFRRGCTHCPSVGDTARPPKSPRAWGGWEEVEGFGVKPQ